MVDNPGSGQAARPAAVESGGPPRHDRVVRHVGKNRPYRRLFLAGTALCALPLAAVDVQAAPADEAAALGLASAKVVQPVSAWAIEDLDFGTVAVSETAGGTVEVGAAGGGVRYSGAAGMACGNGSCGAHPARFAVTGEPNRRYEVLLPAVVHATGRQDSGARLEVTGLAMHAESLPGAGGAGLLDSSGNDRFQVGGTLQVPASTPPDRYEAKVSVVVTYG